MCEQKLNDFQGNAITISFVGKHEHFCAIADSVGKFSKICQNPVLFKKTGFYWGSTTEQPIVSMKIYTIHLLHRKPLDETAD